MSPSGARTGGSESRISDWQGRSNAVSCVKAYEIHKVIFVTGQSFQDFGCNLPGWISTLIV